MRSARLSILCWLITACADNASPLPLGSRGSPLRSICDASPSLLLRELNAYCGALVPAPTTRHPLYWSGALPCRSTRTSIFSAGTIPTTVDYDYSKLYEEPDATYDADGNLATWTPLDFAPNLLVTFLYADGRYVGASVEGRRYLAAYDGNFRIAEGLEGEPRPLYYWTYEDGLLVAEGPPVHGGAPVRYEESLLAFDADGNPQKIPQLEAQDDRFAAAIARRAYFYDDDERVRTIGFGGAPGTYLNRIDLSHAGDRLTSVVLEKSESSEPTLGAQRIEYSYDCP